MSGVKSTINLDLFLPTMDAPDKVYQLFQSLGFKVLDSHLKTNPSVYNLPAKETALVEKIFAISNYDRRFQILLFKLKEDSKEAIRTIPEKILREVDYPFIIFTPDFKTYTFTLVEKVREGPGEFKRKLTKLVVDSSQPYHTDKEILGSLSLSADTKNPVEVYELFQSAFSVEKVTKKFFTEYREVFERLTKEVTRQNKHLKFTLFSREGSVENFTKILLGRLMFLYFIQKRGWLNCFDGWGSGDKKFLYHKFLEAKKEKKDYFKDYLEPLFFDTLNNPRRDKPDQATRFGGRIPFLNGGLFEPNYSYKDPSQVVLIDNGSFEQVFSVFEKYNFTVKEDEPLDKEVAIDPEMLGKVFENLLEENLRKGKGTYYTPREIVHYMCHESLINYLSSEVGISQEEARNFLDREQSLEKKETLSSVIREKAKEIDEKLANIKVLDPACGSGAFLVGMLHEVINARLGLNRELGRSLSEYKLKKETIQNNIYGVDIDPGATEIAKLRLWLTLIVDHNLSEIEPLPNLDYKIMVGNSLLDEFMGVKLFDYEKFFGKSSEKRMKNLFEEESQLSLIEESGRKTTVLKKLQDFQQVYFKESDPEKKKQIRSQIDKIEFDLIEATVKDEVSKLESQTKTIADKYLMAGFGIPTKESERISKISSQQAQILETFNEIKKSNVKPFFLFELNFSDVFDKKGGFDVVIANPPYGIVFNENLKQAYSHLYSSFLRNNDIYVAFYERGINLLKNGGVLNFISPNTFMNGDYFKKFRKVLTGNVKINEMVDFKNAKVFDDPTVFVCIFNGFKKTHIEYPHTFEIKLMAGLLEISEVQTVTLESSSENKFKPPNPLLSKILNKDKVDIVDNLFYVKDVGFNYWTIGRGKTRGNNSIGDRIFYKDTTGKHNNNDTPFLKGSDLHKYFITSPTNYLRKDFKKYLEPKKDVFRYSENFLKLNPKIIYRQTSSTLIAALDRNSFYLDKTVHLVVPKSSSEILDLKYILSLLNSKLFQHFYNYISQENEGRTFSQVKTTYIKQLPIMKLSLEEQAPFIALVDKILQITVSKVYLSEEDKISKVKDLERQLDSLVYKLYDLTPEEIKVVEENTK